MVKHFNIITYIVDRGLKKYTALKNHIKGAKCGQNLIRFFIKINNMGLNDLRKNIFLRKSREVSVERISLCNRGAQYTVIILKGLPHIVLSRGTFLF